MTSGILSLLPLFLYVAVIAVVTLRVRSGSEDTDYFFAGKRLNTLQACISVLSSETSVATLVVFPAAGMKNGYVLLWLLAGYIIGRAIVAFFYLRKLYESSRLTIYHTMSRSHSILEGAYLLAKYISGGVRFFIGAHALHQVLGGPTLMWVGIIAVCVAAYSLTGGLKAVVVMDQVQGSLIIFTGLLLCVVLAGKADFAMDWRPSFTDLDYTRYTFFPALLVGGAVLSIGTHGADQDMILRVLATKTFAQARRSLVASGFAAATVIAIYLTVGCLLRYAGASGLDEKSPLPDYIAQGGVPGLRGLTILLLLAAAMSTLDSTIHSTGAVWKSLIRSKMPGRVWSSFSLVLISGSAAFFLYAAKRHDDYLQLAMGSMNYINGGLIGIFTVFTFFPRRVSALGIALALASGFIVTAIGEWAFAQPLPWTYTVLLSSSAAFLAGIAPSLFIQRGDQAQ